MSHIISGIEFISQLGSYPTGCESVSLTMALRYLGSSVTVREIIDHHLPKGDVPRVLLSSSSQSKLIGPDPWKVFPGDPYSTDGWGCFPPVLESAVSSYNSTLSQTRYRTTPFYQKPLCFFNDLIDNDIPVIFWATLNMAKAYDSDRWVTSENKTVIWHAPMHCLLLIGYDDLGYIFHDPTAGAFTHYDRSSVEEAYRAQGSCGLIVQKLN